MAAKRPKERTPKGGVSTQLHSLLHEMHADNESMARADRPGASGSGSSGACLGAFEPRAREREHTSKPRPNPTMYAGEMTDWRSRSLHAQRSRRYRVDDARRSTGRLRICDPGCVAGTIRTARASSRAHVQTPPKSDHVRPRNDRLTIALSACMQLSQVPSRRRAPINRATQDLRAAVRGWNHSNRAHANASTALCLTPIRAREPKI